MFQTDLRQIFDFIRFSKDKGKLKQLVESDAAFQDMDEDAYDMAAAYTNAKELIAVKKYHGKDGRVNMCEALTALLADSRQEGREEGMVRGEKRFAELTHILMVSGRLADLDIAATDPEYRKKLYREFNLEFEETLFRPR